MNITSLVSARVEEVGHVSDDLSNIGGLKPSVLCAQLCRSERSGNGTESSNSGIRQAAHGTRVVLLEPPGGAVTVKNVAAGQELETVHGRASMSLVSLQESFQGRTHEA